MHRSSQESHNRNADVHSCSANTKIGGGKIIPHLVGSISDRTCIARRLHTIVGHPALYGIIVENDASCPSIVVTRDFLR